MTLYPVSTVLPSWATLHGIKGHRPPRDGDPQKNEGRIETQKNPLNPLAFDTITRKIVRNSVFKEV